MSSGSTNVSRWTSSPPSHRRNEIVTWDAVRATTCHRPPNSSHRRSTSPGESASASAASVANGPYSHSMVPGGLLVMSSVTRLTSRTSLVMRVEIFSNRSYGKRPQSAVMASSLVTGRSTIGWP